MVRIVTRDELNLEKGLLDKLKESVFIYPSDTIYVIGCDATNDVLVERIRSIKQRTNQPFSIIVPTKKIIEQHCEESHGLRSWISKLPGPYTLILNVKKKFFSKYVNPTGETVGVRMPKHWVSDIVRSLNVPVITTSVNLSGDDFMTSLEDLNSEIKRKVDYIIYDGPLAGTPSTVVHLEEDQARTR